MSHNVYYTKFPVPRAENSKTTAFAYCVYYNDVNFFRVFKYEKDNMWWYSIENSAGFVANSIAFNTLRTMSASLWADMRILGLKKNQEWNVIRKVGRCKNV